MSVSAYLPLRWLTRSPRVRALVTSGLFASFVMTGVVVMSAQAQQIVAVPALQARVTDLANLLSPAEEATLESGLASLEQRKGAQVAILTVLTTGEETVEQFSLRVVEAWKLGRAVVDGKQVDDGLLLLVASEDRKIRLEVGYGLEGVIPDAYAKRIISDQMTPNFRRGNYFGGLSQAVTTITKLVDGEDLPAPVPRKSPIDDPGSWVGPIFMGFILGTIVMGIIGRLLGITAGVGASAFLALAGGAALTGMLATGFVTLMLLLFFGGGSGRMRRVGRNTYRSGPPVFIPGGFGGGGFGGGGGGFGGGGGGFGGGGASGGW